MGIRELSDAEVYQLVGQRDEVAGIEYPPQGLQPYHGWLIRTLYRLAQQTVGALKVWRSDASESSVYVAAGRASIGGQSVVFEGADVELGAYNNQRVYLWLFLDQGQGRVGVAEESTGWPSGPHVKLAEVRLEGGKVVEIVDRRLEVMFGV